MKIGIDASSIKINMAGVGHYTYNLIKALEQIDSQNEYFIFTNNIQELKILNLSEHFKIIEVHSKGNNLVWILKTILRIRKEKLDYFISPALFTFAILYPKTILVVHDLAPLKFPKFFPKNSSWKYKLQLDLAVNTAKKIITTSKAVKNEVINMYPFVQNKITAGGFGVNEWAYRQPDKLSQQNVIQKYSLPENYFLSVSTIEPRKNYNQIILVFNEYYKKNKDIHYVIVGKKGWFYEDIYENVKKLECKNNIHFLGYVAEDELAPIYDLSKGVIMLSLYEGIGLSTLEAYARGIPVLASDIPVFHEVLDSYSECVFANPLDSESILTGLNDLAHKNKVGLQSNIASWENVAKILLKGFKVWAN